MANRINEDNEQVIYDTLFMSEPEFGLVYGELYKAHSLFEVKEIYHRVRSGVIDRGVSYNRTLKKTRLERSSFGDLRETQGSEKKSDLPKPKIKPVEVEDELPSKSERGVSLKDEIISLHEAGKNKSQIRDAIGCKYQYVFQTVRKYEEAKKVDL